MKKFDVAIIGAGPAGLFAAWKLVGTGLKLVVIEKGKEALKRDPTKDSRDAIFGVGGAGAYSDGKLNLTYKIGGSPEDLQRSSEETQALIDSVDKTLTKFGSPKEFTGSNGSELSELKRKANKEGIEFIYGKQKHIGTDNVRNVIDKFCAWLKKEGIEFLVETKIEKIERKGNGFLLKGTEEIECAHLVCAPGRGNAYWLREELKGIGADTSYGPIDVGVRIEFPSGIYEKVKRVMYDAKFRWYSKTYDDMVRTFCTNPQGFMSVETFDKFVLVNGHAERKKKSNNTNIALLVRINLTDPVEDSTRYARSIAKLSYTIGGGKPILQRYKDLKNGRRSTWERINKSPITPTLTDVTPGDISMAMPYRIVYDIIEAIEKLDKVIPGIASETTLIYGPEIKFYDTKYATNEFLETNINNLFVAGDASGFSRGIVYAGVTGIIAAEGILKKNN